MKWLHLHQRLYKRHAERVVLVELEVKCVILIGTVDEKNFMLVRLKEIWGVVEEIILLLVVILVYGWEIEAAAEAAAVATLCRWLNFNWLIWAKETKTIIALSAKGPTALLITSII